MAGFDASKAVDRQRVRKQNDVGSGSKREKPIHPNDEAIVGSVHIQLRYHIPGEASMNTKGLFGYRASYEDALAEVESEAENLRQDYENRRKLLNDELQALESQRQDSFRRYVEKNDPELLITINSPIEAERKKSLAAMEELRVGVKEKDKSGKLTGKWEKEPFRTPSDRSIDKLRKALDERHDYVIAYKLVYKGVWFNDRDFNTDKPPKVPQAIAEVSWFDSIEEVEAENEKIPFETPRQFERDQGKVTEDVAYRWIILE